MDPSDGKNRNPRVLIISNDAGDMGAPISLLMLLEDFSQNTSWEFKIIIRAKQGPLYETFAKYGTTEFFYLYCRPEDRIIPQKKPFLKIIRWLINNFYKRQFASSDESFLPQKRHEIRLRQELTRWKPDLIYSNTAMNGDVIRALEIDAPVVVHVRELEWFLKTLDPERLTAFKKDPNFYFTASEAVKNNLVEKYNFHPSRIEVAYAAVYPEAILSKSKEIPVNLLRKQIGITKDEIVVGTVGRIDKRKGSDLYSEIAIKVIRAMNSKYKISFMWLGKGPDKEEIIQAFRNKKLDNRLFMVGAHKNPYPYMNCMDILLTCSRDDPFPRVNLEAGVLEKPVVAFGCSGGSLEFIERDCGFVVPLIDTDEMADRIIQLIKNPTLRKQFGQKAKQKVYERYDVKVVASMIRKTIKRKLNFNM